LDRYVCIHSHFYQPPRENAWLEAVERQDSAYPYHDWNERITAECYGPNSASRILSPDGRIVGILNNYSLISFNFGPTLLSWMERARPDTYGRILEADRLSRERHGGHGSALAQVYNHIIMPLGNERDKRTQVVWGLFDFERRFGRQAEGMWLAETAVDLGTLDLLAEHGIRFTILAPHQAAQVRKTGKGKWGTVRNSGINPRQPYLCRLPSGRSIYIFFYDGPIARELAFGDMLNSGEGFANRLLGAFTEDPEPQLVHVATDGETYGHHHKHGEMALAYCLHSLESNPSAETTLYGEYLERFPPTREVRIHENSSWSCAHGVERWRDDCGCSTGTHPGWHQHWRRPLREALDWLRDRLIPLCEKEAAPLLGSFWAARDAYISLLLDRSPENTDAFLRHHAGRELSREEKTRALQLLETQRHALLMYTSCGWFFEEVSGMETTQVLQYASRAVQLAREATGKDLEGEFSDRLKDAPSNLGRFRDGKTVYEELVRPAQVSLSRVGAHHALSSLFHDSSEADGRVYCFALEGLDAERLTAGKSRLATGRIRVRSELTWEEAVLDYAGLHLGGLNLNAGVRAHGDDRTFSSMRHDVAEAFRAGDVPETIRRLDHHFGDRNYSLQDLFRDGQRTIVDSVYAEAEASIEHVYREVYHAQYPLMQSMANMGIPLPAVLRETAGFVLNHDLRDCLDADPIDPERFEHLAEDIRKWAAPVDRDMLGFHASQRIDGLVTQLSEAPLDETVLARIEALLQAYFRLEVPLNLWKIQNTLYEIGLQQFFLRSRLAETGDASSGQWVERFQRLSDLLGVRFK
jgi:alpha-amylase/alpha-mannosidase (GH57 family)